jgi:hypothetical protein
MSVTYDILVLNFVIVAVVANYLSFKFRHSVRPLGFVLVNCMSHVKWVPCHHGMTRLQVADGGEGLQIWRVAANILNKQWRTADKGWPSSLGVGRGANNSPP